MQKTLDILEKNVQWIVLGLGALFLAWAAYAYVLTPPATVKIDGKLATSDNAALQVEATAKILDRQIKESRAVSFPTPDLVTDWQHHITNPFAAQVAQASWGSQRDLSGAIATPNQGLQGPHIDQLPIAIAPQLLPPTFGLSTVDPQAPNAPQNAAPAGNGAPQPVAQPQTKDTAWITVAAVLPAGPFSKAMLAPFKGTPLDPQFSTFYNTTLLQVVLERQQSNGVDANGAPTFPANEKGTVTPIGPLVADKPFQQQPPGKAATPDAQYQYIDWAQQNQALVATPSFYKVEKGDTWQPPQLPTSGTNGPGAAPAGPGANPPATTAPGTPPPTTPVGTTPAPAPQVNTSAMRYIDPSTAAEDSALPNRRPPFGGQGRFMPQPQQAMNPGGGVGGVIDPFNLQSDILIWAIDETATPGLTYRYRISYVIKNPVFAEQNIAPENLTSVLPIASAPSNWSDPVKVPPMTKFWVAGVQGKDQATLDVFQYKDGDWKPTKPKLNPGDEIPGTELTMVDVRSDETHTGERYVLLTSNTGDMIRRDAKQDESDPDHALMLNPNGPNGPNGVNAPPPPPFNPRGASPGGRMRLQHDDRPIRR